MEEVRPTVSSACAGHGNCDLHVKEAIGAGDFGDDKLIGRIPITEIGQSQAHGCPGVVDALRVFEPGGYENLVKIVGVCWGGKHQSNQCGERNLRNTGTVRATGMSACPRHSGMIV